MTLCFRYEVELEPTTGIGVPSIPDETLKTFRDHLLTFNSWAINGENLNYV